jgi:tRNA(fMet)-specific endonuclease VapC
MGLILDSTILIAAEKHRLNLAALFAAHEQEPVFIAAITASEILHGAERAAPAQKHRRSLYVEGVLTSIEVIDFDLAVARRHAAVWAILEAAGNMIGAHDLQIAATALHYRHDVATLNHKDFKRVAGLHLIETTPFLLA